MTSRISAVAVAVAVVSVLLLEACGGAGSDDAVPDSTSRSAIETGSAVPVATATVESTVPQPLVTEPTDPVPGSLFCEAVEDFLLAIVCPFDAPEVRGEIVQSFFID